MSKARQRKVSAAHRRGAPPPPKGGTMTESEVLAMVSKTLGRPVTSADLDAMMDAGTFPPPVDDDDPRRKALGPKGWHEPKKLN